MHEHLDFIYNKSIRNAFFSGYLFFFFFISSCHRNHRFLVSCLPLGGHLLTHFNALSPGFTAAVHSASLLHGSFSAMNAPTVGELGSIFHLSLTYPSNLSPSPGWDSRHCRQDPRLRFETSRTLFTRLGHLSVVIVNCSFKT